MKSELRAPETFESWNSYWQFRFETSRRNRYFRSEKSERFLRAVANTCADRAIELKKGRIFWRAQLGHDWQLEEQINDSVPAPHGQARMKPFADRAREGRVNPKGVPCLYVATTKETAMSEVRPWIGSHVSVAQFRAVRDMNIIDCSVAHASQPLFLDEPDAPKILKSNWAHIDRAFSEPATSADDTAEYAPTQILAELFKSKGYEGVAYKSAFGADGYNIALFDIEAAAQLNCSLFKVTKLDFAFSEDANAYYIKHPSDE
jgi:RES domain-containing protein